MSLSKTVHNWAKEHGKVGKEPSAMERHAGRAKRKDRKLEDKKRKFAAKMKHEKFPNNSTSDRDEQTHD